MIQNISDLEKEIGEIENVFLLLADYTRDFILGDSVHSEISCMQYIILSYLDNNSNTSITVNDIVKNSGLSYPACTQQLDELSRLGLINRGRSDKDRRLVFVSITPAGRDLLSEILTRRRNGLKQLFTDFKPSEMKQIMESFSMLKHKLLTLKEKI